MEDIKTKIEETKEEASKVEVVDITKRVKSYEDACEVLGETPKDFTNDSPDEIAYKKLKTIIKALNQGWEPNWSDEYERKWFPYFNVNGVDGFSYLTTHYEYYYAYTYIGSRFCFKNEKITKYCANQFLNLYTDMMVVS